MADHPSVFDDPRGAAQRDALDIMHIRPGKRLIAIRKIGRLYAVIAKANGRTAAEAESFGSDMARLIRETLNSIEARGGGGGGTA
jgi:hypothetical protein